MKLRRTIAVLAAIQAALAIVDAIHAARRATQGGRMTIDVPLLRKTLEHITAHPEEHNQAVWAQRTPCGTSYCLAGHVAVMTGHGLDWSPYRDHEFDTHGVAIRAIDGWAASFTDDDRSIRSVARTELGLDYDQGDDLFASENTIADLWHYAHAFTKGEIEIPEEFL